MNNSLTICILTRNRPKFLQEAIESTLQVFGPKTRLIIGDNGNPEPTAELLANLSACYPDASFRHLRNPPGSTYAYNLQVLVDAVHTPWLSILHDDDLYADMPIAKLEAAFAQQSIFFIFSDHWIISAEGERDIIETQANSRHYGRDRLKAGPVKHLGRLAVQQSVCLDGFYIRTDLARAHRFDQRFPFFADNQWMMSVASAADSGGYYLEEKTFSYRKHSLSETVKGIDQIALHASLHAVNLSEISTERALRIRLRRHVPIVLRYSLRRLKIKGFFYALRTLLGLTPRAPALHTRDGENLGE